LNLYSGPFISTNGPKAIVARRGHWDPDETCWIQRRHNFLCSDIARL